MAYLKGVDVSKYQTPSDWSPTGLTFVIPRASIGLTPDPQYPNHIAKAKAAGLVTGAYHFNWDADYDSATATPEEQARFFVKQAGDVDLLFLDVEGAMAFEDAESTAFIAEVHRLGKRCGLYMSASTFRNDGQDYDWIAKWGTTPPSGAWEFWQYTSNGAATDGGRLDLDYFNGTRDQLLALFNRTGGASTVLSHSVPRVPTNSVIKNGAVLYTTDDCMPGTKVDGRENITLSNQRAMPDHGIVRGTTTNGVREVEYVSDTGVHSGLTYFVRTADILRQELIPMTTVVQGLTQAEADALVAAAVKAAEAPLMLSLDAAAAALRVASTTERERLAHAVGEAEAARIRAL